jgi:hypothetical protein
MSPGRLLVDGCDLIFEAGEEKRLIELVLGGIWKAGSLEIYLNDFFQLKNSSWILVVPIFEMQIFTMVWVEFGSVDKVRPCTSLTLDHLHFSTDFQRSKNSKRPLSRLDSELQSLFLSSIIRTSPGLGYRSLIALVPQKHYSTVPNGPGLYDYTTHRWLKQDEAHRQARLVKFSFPVLCEKVVNSSPGGSEIVTYEKREDAYNRQFIFHLDNGEIVC